jgi:cysteine synthase A
MPALKGIDVYLKNESAFPIGSLKYRLVRAMLGQAIADGRLRADTPVIAATSGAVAVAGARFARLLDLPFTAVVPPQTPTDALIPGFLPTVIDLVIPVPDAASIAAMRWLHTAAGIHAGPATGTSLWGVCHLAARMQGTGTEGSVVTLIGDDSEPYRTTHLDPAWTLARDLDPTPYEADLERLARTGEWPTAPSAD